MDMSVFEIIGPPMVGPSSSHTAGACRIGWMARSLLGETPLTATIFLHGSFLATGQGHGTDQALIAGLLGFFPDDERLKDSFEHAAAANFHYEFEPIDLGAQAHPNSAKIVVSGAKNRLSILASSVGGGAVEATRIDDFNVELRGTLGTLAIWHRDEPGFLSRVTAVLSCANLNVATIRTSRQVRGANAFTAIEIDGGCPNDVLSVINRAQNIQRVAHIPILPGF